MNKLPLKYQSVTQGEWKVYKWDDETEVGVTPVSGSLPDVANCNIDASELTFADKVANATIMADSKRLAGAVVLLREALESLVNATDRTNGVVIKALADTAEWTT